MKEYILKVFQKGWQVEVGMLIVWLPKASIASMSKT